MSNTQYKKDITRLKNLLRDYRDHMITKLSDISVVKSIEVIDNCIKIITQNL